MNENSKVIVNGNGKQTVSVFSSPVRYLDEAGNWQDIDNTIHINTNASPVVYKYVTKANAFTVGFKGTPTAPEFIRFIYGRGTRGSLSMTLNGLYYLDANTDQRAFIATPSAAVGLVSGDKMIYTDAFPGVALEFTVMSDRLKDNVILSEAFKTWAPSPAVYGLDPATSFLVLSYTLNSKHGERDVTKRLAFLGSDGQEQIWAEPLTAQDANGEDLAPFELYDPAIKEFVFGISYNTTQAAAYPIEIDPTLTTASGVHDGYMRKKISDGTYSRYTSQSTDKIGTDGYYIYRHYCRIDITPYASQTVYNSQYRYFPTASGTLDWNLDQIPDFGTLDATAADWNLIATHTYPEILRTINTFQYVNINLVMAKGGWAAFRTMGTPEPTAATSGKIAGTVAGNGNATNKPAIIFDAYDTFAQDASTAGGGQITVNWTNGGGLVAGDKHRIYYKAGTGLTAADIKTGSYVDTTLHTAASHTVTGLTDGVNYCFVIVDLQQVDGTFYEGATSNVANAVPEVSVISAIMYADTKRTVTSNATAPVDTYRQVTTGLVGRATVDTYRKVIKQGTALADTLRKAQATGTALVDTLRIIPKFNRASTGKLKAERWLTNTLGNYEVAGTVAWNEAGHVALGQETPGIYGRIRDLNFSGTDYIMTVKITHIGTFETTASLTNLVIRRNISTGHAYWVKLDDYNNNFDLVSWDGVTSVTVDTAPFTFVRGTQYIVKLSAIGTTIRGKIYVAGDPEPSTWTVEALNNTVSSEGGWQIFSSDLVANFDAIYIYGGTTVTVGGLTQGNHKARLGNSVALPDDTGTAIIDCEHEYLPAATLEVLNSSDTVLDIYTTEPADIWGGDSYTYIASIVGQVYADLKRLVTALRSTPADTERRTQQNNTALGDTVRKAQATGTAPADTRRKVSKAALANNDTYRKALAKALTASDTVRKVGKAAGPILDTLRKLTSTVTATADTRRKTQSNAQAQADTRRGISKLAQAAGDTYRKTQAAVSAQVDAKRKNLANAIGTSDTYRKVSLLTEALADTARKTRAFVTVTTDTYRMLQYTVTLTFQTKRRVQNTVLAVGDTYRQVSFSILNMVDTTRRTLNNAAQGVDAKRRIQNTSQYIGDTYRKTLKAAVTQADTKRRTAALITALADTHRTVQLITSGIAQVDTYRKVIKNVAAQADLNRKTLATAVANSDTYRKALRSVAALADTYRRTHANAVTQADTYRKTLAQVAAASDTVRKTLEAAQALADTYRQLNSNFTGYVTADTVRRIKAQVSTQADTVRKARINLAFVADAKRRVGVKALFLNDTLRKATTKALANPDTYRKIRNLTTAMAESKRRLGVLTIFLTDTLRKATGTASAQADTYRKALANTLALTDTKRKLTANITAVADARRKVQGTASLVLDTLRGVISRLLRRAPDYGIQEMADRYLTAEIDDHYSTVEMGEKYEVVEVESRWEVTEGAEKYEMKEDGTEMKTFTLGEEKEVGVEITSTDGTAFTVDAATYKYMDGITELSSGGCSVDGGKVYILLKPATAGYSQKVVFTITLQPMGIDEQPDLSKNKETFKVTVTLTVNE